MAHPSLLTIGTVTCLATDDLLGRDELVGQLGADRFSIGRFNAGDTIEAAVSRPIASGVDTLVISEADLTGDNELIRVDLTQGMDRDRVVGILTGRARYDLSLRVASESDG